MQQIKTKEKPVDWFVTDTYYESGNKQFISLEPQFKNGKDICGCRNCEECKREGHIDKREIFGVKHIQLVAANPKPHKADPMDGSVYFGYGIELEAEQAEPIKYMYASGKDFFIYKVSEVKDV